MTFALTPVQPIVDSVTQVTASIFNYWRTAIAQAIDGAGGSAGTPYTPSTQIGIGGAGLRLYGATALELDATSVCVQDVGGVFNWNGTQNLSAGASINLQGSGFDFATINLNAASSLEVNTGSLVDVNGGDLIVHPGAGFQMYSTELVANGTGLINVGDTGSLGTGGLNVNKDSNIVVNGVSGHLAQVVFKEFGVLQIGTNSDTGSTLQVWSGNTLAMFTGSTANLGGATTLSDLVSTTQTGPFTQNGGSAYGVGRVLAITSSGGTHSISNPQNYDLIFVQGNTGGNSDTIALSMPGGLPDGVRLRIAHPQFINKGTVLVTGTYNGGQAVNPAGPGLGDTGSGGFSAVATTGWCDIESATIGGVSQWIVTGYTQCT